MRRTVGALNGKSSPQDLQDRRGNRMESHEYFMVSTQENS